MKQTENGCNFRKCKRTRFYSESHEGENEENCSIRCYKNNFSEHHLLNLNFDVQHHRCRSDCLSIHKPIQNIGSLDGTIHQSVDRRETSTSKSCFRSHTKKANKRVIFKLLPPQIEANNNSGIQNEDSKRDSTYSNSCLDSSNTIKILHIDHNCKIPNYSDEQLRKPPVKRRRDVSIRKMSNCSLSDSRGFLCIPSIAQRKESSQSLCTITTDSNSKKLSDTSISLFNTKETKSKSLCESIKSIRITPRKKIIKLRRKSDHKKLNSISLVKTDNLKSEDSILRNECINQNGIMDNNIDFGKC